MVFWLLAIAATAIACAALYYASAGRAVNATAVDAAGAATAHFRLQLGEIEADIRNGRIGEAEGAAAKAELARELLRHEARAEPQPRGARLERAALPAAVAAVALLATGIYAVLGTPELPGQPLAERAAPTDASRLDTAIAALEQELANRPDEPDLLALAGSAYLQAGRVDDAIRVFRHALDVAPPTADRETDLAEALLLQSGEIAGEPETLFRSAAARDPNHVRSRFYLAAEATRAGEYDSAVGLWQELLALGKEGDAWLPMAQSGLAAAQQGLDGAAAGVDDAAIRDMVEGLSTRLMAEGGTIAEWTRLVRSRLVLGEPEAAQAAYDAARAAYPNAADRAELDAVAAAGGLTL